MQSLTSHELTFLFYYYRDCESRLQQTANTNLYHITKFSLNLSYTVLYFSKKTLVSRYFHPLEFFLDHCISLFSVLRISQLESHVYRKRDSKSFYYQDRICHFRNEKGTGAEMHPSVVSGIVTRDTLISY